MADDTISAITPAEREQLRLSQTVVTPDAIEERVNFGLFEEQLERNGGSAWWLEVQDVAALAIKSIHRFPSNLQRIGRDRDYIAPGTVAIGPYYHGAPELQSMEKIKRRATDYFFHGSDELRGATYEKIIPIARMARGCYTDTDALEGISDDEFVSMMFIDGCFLLQFVNTLSPRSGETSLPISMIHPHLFGIMRDMMLLENQIPWPVIEFLMELKRISIGDLTHCLSSCLDALVSKEHVIVDFHEGYKPTHLLCLLRSCKVGRRVWEEPYSNNPKSVSTSAAELAEIGIKLKASKTKQFSDMNIVKGPFFAKLSLVPLSLDSVTTCWLVNMAAFEICAATSLADDYYVNSYLSVVALLMNQEDDVRELRDRRIVQSFSSDQQTLEFFKGLAPNLVTGGAYWRLIADLEKYKHKRRMWISIYRFVYNNTKIIATVLSIIGVLVGIFKTLLSLKKKQQ
ncbi:hypothetical protein ACP70R_008041 [Stipagrostis hirtigluma subsp. patula]